jgi:hemin uptake protein HemP
MNASGSRFDAADAGTPGPPASAPARRVDSAALFGGRREVVIVHGDQEYRLRVTRADKLILTK